MEHPEITQRERWGVPDAPREYRSCHHCDTFHAFERACGCVICNKCAVLCFDCGQAFCVAHTYEAAGDEGERVRICHNCQSNRNYFEAQKEIAEERKIA